MCKKSCIKTLSFSSTCIICKQWLKVPRWVLLNQTVLLTQIIILWKYIQQNINEFKLVDLFNREGARAPFNPVRVTELTLGRKYKVICIRTVPTKYGVKPICDLDNGESIYLPAKYCKALPKDEWNNNRLHVETKNTTVTYLGHENDKWRTAILKFSTGNDGVEEDVSFCLRTAQWLCKPKDEVAKIDDPTADTIRLTTTKWHMIDYILDTLLKTIILTLLLTINIVLVKKYWYNKQYNKQSIYF